MAKQKDYSRLSREELIKHIEKLEGKKTYGLVWDEERVPEKVVMDCKDNLPVLTEDKGKEILTNEDEPTHILIEGDNYHALSVLNYTHKGKIDLIYIDPPYNTGNNDFKYNDKWINELDTFKHSMWLNFMKNRLSLAKDLLKEEGVIFISIGNDEVFNLKHLCDKLFPEFVSFMIRQGVKGGTRSKSVISANQDYILIYAKSEDNCLKGQLIDSLPLDQKDEEGPFRKGRELNKWGAGSAREDAPKMWFPIPGPNGEDVYPIRNDGSEGRWRWGKKKMFKASQNKDLIFEKRSDGTYIVYDKIRDESQREIAYSSLLIDSIYSNAAGTKELKLLFNDKIPFSYPKPMSLIKYFVNMLNDDSSIILDFFAGSGTTGHAILELNKEDGTNHQFILATNNEVDAKTEDILKIKGYEKGSLEYEERGICQLATYPRLKKVIEGFDYTGDILEELFFEKINLTKFKKAEKYLEKIKEIKEEKRESYKELKTSFDNGKLLLIGKKEIKGKYLGLGNNLRYFKADKSSFVENNANRDQLKIDITHKCTEMLCIKEGVYNLLKEHKEHGENVWKLFRQRDKYMAVYYDFAGESLEGLRKELEGVEGEKILYCFTTDVHGLDAHNFRDWKGIKLEAIPQKILDVYKRIFN
jgi:adenine-specific DNA-methyltransferase